MSKTNKTKPYIVTFYRKDTSYYRHEGEFEAENKEQAKQMALQEWEDGSGSKWQHPIHDLFEDEDVPWTWRWWKKPTCKLVRN